MRLSGQGLTDSASIAAFSEARAASLRVSERISQELAKKSPQTGPERPCWARNSVMVRYCRRIWRS